jgi:hypothetical protein
MPTKYDRFDIDCGRERPYAGHEGPRIDGHKEPFVLMAVTKGLRAYRRVGLFRSCWSIRRAN